MNNVDPLALLTQTLERIANRLPISPKSTSSCPGITRPERPRLRAYDTNAKAAPPK
ncbi:hypothetical protein [Mesorhizobium sp. AR07]|uniref:hypothetical protein n=1 Tax=Mesorhizobium sp. AR07 TaxID=2865838 RepID=UPI0039B6F786